MAAHRYWRLFITASNNTAIEIGEVQLRATSGGADLTGSGTASASTTYSGSYLPAYAFDNSNSTAWGGASGDVSAAWLAYDFGSGVSHDIAEVVVQASAGSGAVYAPKDWSVQYSDDGSAWTTKWTVTSQTAWTGSEARTFTAPIVAVTVRKLYGVAVLGPPQAAVTARKVYGLAVLHDTAVAPIPTTRRRPVIAALS